MNGEALCDPVTGSALFHPTVGAGLYAYASAESIVGLIFSAYGAIGLPDDPPTPGYTLWTDPEEDPARPGIPVYPYSTDDGHITGTDVFWYTVGEYVGHQAEYTRMDDPGHWKYTRHQVTRPYVEGNPEGVPEMPYPPVSFEYSSHPGEGAYLDGEHAWNAVVTPAPGGGDYDGSVSLGSFVPYDLREDSPVEGLMWVGETTYTGILLDRRTSTYAKQEIGFFFTDQESGLGKWRLAAYQFPRIHNDVAWVFFESAEVSLTGWVPESVVLTLVAKEIRKWVPENPLSGVEWQHWPTSVTLTATSS